MRYGGICRAYGGRISSSSRSWSERRKESLDEYHRITCLRPDGCRFIQTVKYSGTSWIAIQVQKLICIVTHSISREKPEKLDLFEICHDPCYKVMAVVSSILGNGEIQDGSGIASSFAEFNEKAAIHFLEKVLTKRSDFTLEETVQVTISAFGYLFPENIKADEIQISVMTSDQTIALPTVAIEALLENKNINLCSFLPYPVISILQHKCCHGEKKDLSEHESSSEANNTGTNSGRLSLMESSSSCESCSSKAEEAQDKLD